MTDVGMNLTGVSYFSSEFPFIDRMRMAGQWSAQGTNPGPVQLDARGYPVGMPAGASNLYFMIPVDPPTAGTSRTYVLTYEGTAQFSLVTSTIIQSEPGRIVFTTSNQSQYEYVGVSGLTTDSPLSNMHIVRADQEASFLQGETFNPAFLEKIDNFDVLRFMDWGNTNAAFGGEWADRTTVDQMSWSYNISRTVPIEVMVELSNRTGSDMWYNIPVEASDDYVRQAVQYIRDNLRPDLKLRLEYSNEVWNWIFPQAHYALRQGATMFGRDANGDGVVNPNDPAEAEGLGNPLFYGYRAAQIASIAQTIFGADSETRLANVLSTITVYQGYEQAIFDGVRRAGLGTVSQLFDDWAITSYFGGHLTGETAADRQTLLGWARGGAAGLDAAFEALMRGTGIEAQGSVAYLQSILGYQASVAQQQGLNLVAYEGGFGFWATNFAVEDQPAMMDFLARLKADPRMGDAYRQMMGDLAAAGGDLMNAFTNASPDGTLASWGTLNSIYQDSPAYQALISVNTDTADVSTALSSYVLGSKINNLTYQGADDFTGTGNARDNVLRSGAGNDVLRGRGGDDVLYSGAGDDLLDGGAGRDRMFGGPGNDVYIVTERGDEVVELPGEGTDEVRTSLPDYRLAVDLENLTFIGTGRFEARGNTARNVIRGGDGDDRLLGYAGNDWMIAGAGNDVLNGGEGDDRMEGGPGDDNYTVKQAGDEVIELPGEGHDTVRVHLATWTLPTNVEDVIFRGTGDFTGTGNALDNMMRGGAGNDRLAGLGGNDVLVGLEGDDLLDGGTGDDRMEGGAGDDIYVVDAVGDVVVELPSEGADEVRTSLSGYTLGADVEHLTYTGAAVFTGIGNALSNRITGGNTASFLYGMAGDDVLNGGDGDDQLDGGEGSDRMAGGRGNDVYVVDSEGDVIVEGPGGGRDQVRTTLARYTLATDLEDLAYLGTSAFLGTGNAAANTIEGNAGDDRLYGMGGDDVLVGGQGNDLLDGGTGADRMVGGQGDDLYFVDNAGDQVQELPGQGRDEVRLSLNSYTMSAEVEVLTFTGSGWLYAAGNASDNVIRGGSDGNLLVGNAGNDQLYGGNGNDVLDGGTGADLMDGGLGDDEYIVDDAGDTIVDAGGTDIVRSTVSYALGSGLENLQLRGTAAINGTGNDLVNQLLGNEADNVLKGLGGDDSLWGQGGNDRLEGGEGRDTLFGEAGNDVLLGGSGDDLLYGGDGDDVLEGGPGKDILQGQAGADTYRFGPGDLARTSDASDVIFGFSRDEGDKIDFSLFDANPATAGRDAFRFLGTGAFSGHAGELRVDVNGGAWLVQGDLDGDRVADFVLGVGTGSTLVPVAADFVL